jgi:hypothetical protein
MKHNKLILGFLIGTIAVAGISCKKYLDNAFPNPNKPTVVDPDLVFPSMINVMARGIQFDSRFITRYDQMLAHTTSGTTWDRMGYDPGSDNGGDQWRSNYYALGKNLLNVISAGRATARPAYAGAGYAIFAWSWLLLTDIHGEVILKEAFKSDQLTFKYDTQEEVYDYVKVLCDSAIYYLTQAKALPASSFSTGDQYFYGGDVSKWIKFTNGVRAKLYNRYINKANYNADSVIYFADQSLASAADDALVKFMTGPIFNDQMNFFGPTRNNMGVYRQTEWFMKMLNGTIFPTANDPRMKYLFLPAQDGVYRGLPINSGESGLAANQRPPNFWGLYSTGTTSGGVDTGARTYFKNQSPFPIMTYAEIQFIKAEAAFKKGDKATAYTAYMNGINGSFDELLGNGYTGYTPISPTDRATYLANPNIAVTAAGLTLSHIMIQKFIALWFWGHEEVWVDMRKYQYNPTVFTGYTPPPSLYPDNAGKLVYRIRPRYNSEYLWNVDELKRIGGLDLDYHTKPIWFSLP